MFGEGGTYLGEEDESQDVTQSGLEEEKTQAHIVSQPPLVQAPLLPAPELDYDEKTFKRQGPPPPLLSQAPLLPAPELDFDEKTFKRQGPPPLPKGPAVFDYEEKTLKRQGPAAPPAASAFDEPARMETAAAELPPEIPTRQLDQASFQKIAEDVRGVLPELASGSEEATAVHLLSAPPQPADYLPEPGPEGLELTPELPESPEPAPGPEGPAEDKTTMQPLPEGPGLAQRARVLWARAQALWAKVQPRAAEAWQRARRRPALLAAVGSGGVVAIALVAFLLSGESAAEREARTVQLRPGTDGTVARVVVGKDGRVKKGQLLLVVAADRAGADSADLGPLEQNLRAARTALKRARSGAALKKIAAEVARKKAAVTSAIRAETAVAAKVKKKKATVEQLALATAKVHSAEERLAKATDRQAQLEAKAPAEIAQAQGDVETAQSELDMARAKASLVELRSPVDGVVVSPDPAQLLGKKVHRGEPILAVLADEE